MEFKSSREKMYNTRSDTYEFLKAWLKDSSMSLEHNFA